MKICEIIGTLDPAYGGPVEGVRDMSAHLQRLGHDVQIVCLDSKYSSWLKNFEVKVNAIGPSIFKYRFNFSLISWLIRNKLNYDILIVNGVWQFHSFAVFVASKITGKPYVVYTHGMLDPWFRKAFPLKHIKKQIYWFFIERFVLRGAKGVIFTTEEEKNLSSQSFSPFEMKQVVINFGIEGLPDLPVQTKAAFFEKYPNLIGKKCILFLSRIHKKKGCDLLIEAFSRVFRNHEFYRLIIVGNDQDGLRPSFEKVARNLGVSEQIVWTGMVGEQMKWSAFNACEVFILPSHSENFGSALVESLSAGRPVLTTNKVNIWREILSYGSGFVENDDLDGAINLLQKWSSLADAEKSVMGLSAQHCFKEIFDIRAAALNLSNYLNAVISISD